MPKEVIRSIKSKKDRQHNDQKKAQRTNKDLQNTTQKTKNRATRTPLQTGRDSSSCCTCVNEQRHIFHLEKKCEC